MSAREFKLKLIEALLSRDIFTQMPSKMEIRTRCPFCGDSTKRSDTGHLYLRVDPDDNSPIVYNCFKCPAKGILGYEELEMLGVTGESFLKGINELNKTSDKTFMAKTKNDYFQYKIPKPRRMNKIDYIQNRLKVHLTDKDIYEMKIITSLKDFIMANDLHSLTCEKELARFVERNYVGFLSNNGAYILFRDITDSSKIRWYKYPITEESKGNKVFYSIRSNLNLYETDDIIINIAEGIMDTISVYKNYFYDKPNTLNVSICGKYYYNMVKYLLGVGFVGSNIKMNIFADNDGNVDTSAEYLTKVLRKYSNLVGQMKLFYNRKSKDCGVPRKEILLKEYIV